jgi:hypothetical protein
MPPTWESEFHWSRNRIEHPSFAALIILFAILPIWPSAQLIVNLLPSSYVSLQDCGKAIGTALSGSSAEWQLSG